MFLGAVDQEARQERDILAVEAEGPSFSSLCADSVDGRSMGWNSSAGPLGDENAFVTVSLTAVLFLVPHLVYVMLRRQPMGTYHWAVI